MLKRIFDELNKNNTITSSDNQIEDIKSLIDNGNHDKTTIYGVLLSCVRYGYLEIVEHLFEKGVIHNIDYMLQLSSEYGQLDVVRFFIKNVANVNSSSDIALYYSVKNGHLDVVRFLFNNGADINRSILLYLSSTNGHLDILRFLLEHIAVIGKPYESALNQAATNGHLHIIKYLIESGTDVHTNGDYALRISAGNGWMRIVKYLIANGANVNACNDEALLNSLKNGKYKMAKYLLNIGAKYDHVTNICAIKGYTGAVDFLIKNCDDVHLNEYALHLSIQCHKFKILKLLIKAGADIHYNNDYALREVVKCKSYKVCKFLIENNANINAIDDDAIKRIVSGGDIYFVKYLLELGVDCKGKKCNSLRISLQNLRFKMAELLLSYYNIEELKIVFHEYHFYIESFLAARDLSKHYNVIQALRELGIDIFDLIENEKL